MKTQTPIYMINPIKSQLDSFTPSIYSNELALNLKSGFRIQAEMINAETRYQLLLKRYLLSLSWKDKVLGASST